VRALKNNFCEQQNGTRITPTPAKSGQQWSLKWTFIDFKSEPISGIYRTQSAGLWPGLHYALGLAMSRGIWYWGLGFGTWLGIADEDEGREPSQPDCHLPSSSISHSISVVSACWCSPFHFVDFYTLHGISKYLVISSFRSSINIGSWQLKKW